MAAFKTLFLTSLVFSLLSCNLLSKDTSSCMENPDSDSLLVFVGEKIRVDEVDAGSHSMDAKFIAKYKILEKVCGDYNKDTITFTVYDHYGRPAFEEYQTVLLYVVKVEERYYHEKYMYNDLYQTKEGKWASPYSTDDYWRLDTPANIEPVKIDFAQEVSFSIAGRKKQYVKQVFPEPFYRIEGDKAIAVYGNYVPELFELKKRGVLGARGFYGGDNTANVIAHEPIELENSESMELTTKETAQLKAVWQKLLNSIKEHKDEDIKAMSFDSVTCSVCEGFAEPSFYNDKEPIDSFIATSYRNLPNTELWKQMNMGKYEITATKYPDRLPENFQLTPGQSYIVYEITFSFTNKFEDYNHPSSHSFRFVKVNGAFRFEGMSSI